MTAPDHSPPADTASTASDPEVLLAATNFFTSIVDGRLSFEGFVGTQDLFDHLLHLAALLHPQRRAVSHQADAATAVGRRHQLATRLTQALETDGWTRIETPGRRWHTWYCIPVAGDNEVLFHALIPDDLTAWHAAPFLGNAVVSLAKSRGVTPSHLFIDLVHP